MIEEAKKLLDGCVFYSEVTYNEMQDVYRAMAQAYLGASQWYTCVNGHPFAVGECGLPMQQARCPECDSPVGGRSHVAVEGVRRADDMQREFRQAPGDGWRG